MKEQTTLHLVGVDTCNLPRIPQDVLDRCTALVVSKRIREEANHLRSSFEACSLLPIAPLNEALTQIGKALEKGDVAVLASGDPMFFGIGRRLIEKFGRNRMKVYPELSSVQHLFSYFKVHWDDVFFLSLHGRDAQRATGSILSHEKVLLLTDGINRPELTAQQLCSFLGPERSRQIHAYVGENIGMQGERFVSGHLRDVAEMKFGPLCCMLLVRKSRKISPQPVLGLTEDRIVHSRGLITKNEVRAAVLHSLALGQKSVLWDIGAGSGSVSLEASRLQQDLLVYAIEKNDDQYVNILNNIDKYGVFTMKAVKGEAPEVLENLPSPDRVFIGGSGGNLKEIINACCKSLASGGRIVVTAVLDKTRQQAPRLLHDAGLAVETSTIAVTRNVYPENEPQQFNPITIIIGRKET